MLAFHVVPFILFGFYWVRHRLLFLSSFFSSSSSLFTSHHIITITSSPPHPIFIFFFFAFDSHSHLITPQDNATLGSRAAIGIYSITTILNHLIIASHDTIINSRHGYLTSLKIPFFLVRLSVSHRHIIGSRSWLTLLKNSFSLLWSPFPWFGPDYTYSPRTGQDSHSLLVTYPQKYTRKQGSILKIPVSVSVSVSQLSVSSFG
ncbi:hypothetical protein M422DRAFT_25127 [Sphaerobolus stellatus SS14]|nr:hypothetical protein M422DRAFT_25127 [Sphaerobolus stellatus SS14]